MALNTSNAQLAAVQQLANTDGTVSTLAVARQLRRKYGIGISPDSLSSTQKQQVIKSRKNLTKKLTKQEKFEVLQHFRTVFKDPTTRSVVASNAVNTHLLETADNQIKEAGLKSKNFLEASSTEIATTPVFSTPSNPNISPQTPQQTPQPGAMPTPSVSPIAPLGPEPTPEPNSDEEELTEENSPADTFNDSISGPVESEPSSTTTTTPAGEQVVEQLQESMATSSELVDKAAQAVDASAKATTELQKTVKDTTDALKALTEAQAKTETSSPALSQQVLAQIQADPSLAKLVKDGLLKWDDLLGKNPEPGKEGHVAGVEVGDPVVLPEKLQKVIDNLQTARTRESASLTGAIEVNRAARTTTGFRPSDTGYFPGRQVWMPIRAPPPSLPGRR